MFFFTVFWCVDDLRLRKLMKKPWTLVTYLSIGKLQEEENRYYLERKIRASEVILKHDQEVLKYLVNKFCGINVREKRLQNVVVVFI